MGMGGVPPAVAANEGTARVVLSVDEAGLSQLAAGAGPIIVPAHPRRPPQSTVHVTGIVSVAAAGDPLPSRPSVIFQPPRAAEGAANTSAPCSDDATAAAGAQPNANA